MAEPLKNMYHPAFYKRLTPFLADLITGFNTQHFLDDIFNDKWEMMALKERLHHTTLVLEKHIALPFDKAAPLLLKLVENLEENGVKEEVIEFMFLPDYIETFGGDHFELSIHALERITQFTSCEFAVRPFILEHPDRMILIMEKWSQHENYKVRRLASEGFRPRLPWAMALPALKKNPDPILSILEKMMDDEHAWVRRSVANNLNDISKDNPEKMLRLCKAHFGKNKNVDWVIKHGCRSLLKAGNTHTLSLFGYASVKNVTLSNFTIATKEVQIGNHLEFSFRIENSSRKDLKIRIEYGLWYLKKNGSHSRKVFKISEKNIEGKARINVERRQSFKIITTRTFYPGQHHLSLIINGIELQKLPFSLLPA